MNNIQNTDHHPRHYFSRPCCPGIASYQLVPQKITHLVNSQYVRRFFNSILTLPPKNFGNDIAVGPAIRVSTFNRANAREIKRKLNFKILICLISRPRGRSLPPMGQLLFAKIFQQNRPIRHPISVAP